MDTLLQPRPVEKPRLTANEREVIVTYNDAEQCWRVYSDSRTMRGAVLRLARALGVEVQRLGAGLEFTVPAGMLRLAAKRKHPGRVRNLQTPL